uniref:Uncharacterized protein n=2 Tax=Sar TaxID=2698737 RepID=A0A7S2WGF8_9STRA|mmetsp:Transcript_13654/g.22290  ORF Transcript_13654/g.22290 Transcript_13654/m.22290 type:complete len:353 (-) Transcript_13654:53-1111(-)|eukprot:CAMPEP_0203746116 /NCGR_PEP_ID=MMETSP0098-20131031/1646_1 /ASSEMBLY_ACC=CAM_ASM_000208 /TAXON_ID=96639 /ORGANISM=" , Strain NY0313808BC1" /LENGTH=352 /DNA_ID=CAMNT_0050634091 /DNA_START=96 /DNA_END=1154 /DNA_ORIENTATION=+
MKTSVFFAAIATCRAAYVPYKQPPAQCDCDSSCVVWGDPFIQQFSGDIAKTNHKKFLVYANPQVSIEADTKEYNSTQVVTFKAKGSKAKHVNAAECVGKSNTHILFESSVGQVNVKVYCHDKPFNSSEARAPHYLNIVVNSICHGEAPNPNLNELAAGASGECVKFSGDYERRKGGGLPVPVPQGGCKCSHTCGAFGDPHMTTFDGDVGILKLPSYSTIQLYGLKNVSVRAKLDKMLHVQALQMDGIDMENVASTARDDNCNDDKLKNHEKPIWAKTIPSYDDGELTIEVYCNTRPNNRPLDHFYYDVVLTKTDITKGVFYKTFSEMQKALNATGQCIRMSAHTAEDLNVER